MSRYQVNPDRTYFNHEGKMPPLRREETPAALPAPGKHTHPKLITDTTLRDGAQDPCFAIFPNETKLKYFDLLHQLDNGCGVIDAVEVFIYHKRDIWTLEKLLERGYDHPRVTTWTRATPKDIAALVEVSGGRVMETGMLASCSDHHIFDRLTFRGKEEAIESYLAPIRTARESGIVPRIHLEDATRADLEGWVLPFMERVLAETAGKALFRICDTLGVGSPDPYAALPYGVPRLVSAVSLATGAELEFHGHNDFGYATANSMAALRYGCKRVNAAFGGLGERTGNAPLEQVLANYVREYGDPGLKLEALSEMAALIEREVTPLPAKLPIVGTGIFTTQAGLHQTGVHRQAEAQGGLIYLPFDPGLVGRQGAALSRIGGLSGMDGLISALNQHYAKDNGQARRFSSFSRTLKLLYDRIHEAYDGVYQPDQDRYVGFRRSFFEIEELVQMVADLESSRHRPGSQP